MQDKIERTLSFKKIEVIKALTKYFQLNLKDWEIGGMYFEETDNDVSSLEIDLTHKNG